MFEIMQKNVKKMTVNYSPNFNIKKRDKKKIKYLIYHYTGMRNENLAVKRLTSFNSNVSCHYFITKSGKLIQMVPDLYVAWHAGISFWRNEHSLNHKSIGIEISNPGHDHEYKNFNKNQIKCLVKISKILIKKYKIKKKNILGHSDVAPLRKKDPGEKFPWKYLSNNKIGVWHSLNKNELRLLRTKSLNSNFSLFIKYLKKIGYNVKYSKSSELRKIVKVFQMRYRPELINGKIDLECFQIAKSLNILK